MKTLYFVRHAKSSWDTDSLNDIDRPLNYRGLAAAPIAGKKLREKGIMPDIIYSSPANRALTTARMISEELGYPIDKIEIKEKIYESQPSVIFEIIESTPNSINSIMIVGHNPTHTQIFERLYGKRVNALNTCSVFAFEFEIDSWDTILNAEPNFLFLDSPKRS